MPTLFAGLRMPARTLLLRIAGVSAAVLLCSGAVHGQAAPTPTPPASEIPPKVVPPVKSINLSGAAPTSTPKATAAPRMPGPASGAGPQVPATEQVTAGGAAQGTQPGAPAARNVPAGNAPAMPVAPLKVAPVVAVPQLGGGAAAMAPTVRTREVAHDKPAEECNRSSAEWPSDPLRIAVLDFRYPTDREEAHDVGTTGGGAGTAIADLIFARMETLEQRDPRFAFSRGDRRRLDRSDFAGAAREGRKLGADAVLTGTLAPVLPEGAPADAQPRAYELRAGLVDTCTGQLLLRLSSVACPQALTPGLDPAISGPGAQPCERFSVPAAQVTDPKANAEAFTPLLNALLYPLEHNETPPEKGGAPRMGSAGAVTQVFTTPSATNVAIQLPAKLHLAVGDQVAIHGWRITKNPQTYTLHNLRDEEIGRLTIKAIEGTTASGTFIGDFPPRIGDTAEVVTP
jgi:hypothetical protein